MRVIHLAPVPGHRFTLVDRPSADPRPAAAFYREVAGLAIDPPFVVPIVDEHRIGRLDSRGAEETGRHSGSHAQIWIAYIGVDDVDTSAAKAGVLGGQVLLPPTEFPGFGRAAVLRDSEGLAFGVFTRGR